MNTPEAWSERARLENPYDAVMWSEHGQTERHLATLHAVDPAQDESVLDFGCGLGAFAQYFDPPGYTGYDWAFGMVQRAKLEHPEHRFISTLPWQHFDLVVCIGTFNLPGSVSETNKTISSLWERTDRALAVSLYSGNDERCLIYDPYDVCDFAAMSVRWRVERIRHNDLLLVMWK